MPRHRISQVDLAGMTATCAECGTDTPIKRRGEAGYRCRVAYRATKGGTRESRLRRRVGERRMVLPDDVDVLAITQCENPGCDRTERMATDHDHSTGLYRGRLCGPCNVALGFLADNSDRIRGLAEYLETRTS